MTRASISLEQEAPLQFGILRDIKESGVVLVEVLKHPHHERTGRICTPKSVRKETRFVDLDRCWWM